MRRKRPRAPSRRSTPSPGREPPWLLLLHQLPAKPDYLRVKVWRRLRRMEAVPIKSSVSALPADADGREDFEWLIHEINAAGGEAILCEARFLAGLDPGRRAALARAAARANDRVSLPPTSRPPNPELAQVRTRRRVWVTRRDVRVDRIASAWLIRRWIDPEAQFRFVEAERHRVVRGEVRFDMFEAEYTHVGDACTFEVLASAFAPDDSVLATVAEIVHDIDCKEAKFGRPEAPGMERLIQGITIAHSSDEVRLERGFALFDDLYTALTRSKPGPGNA